MMIYVTLVVVLCYLLESTAINAVADSLVSKKAWIRWFRQTS